MFCGLHDASNRIDDSGAALDGYIAGLHQRQVTMKSKQNPKNSDRRTATALGSSTRTKTKVKA
jgi:hypothetical protein